MRKRQSLRLLSLLVALFLFQNAFSQSTITGTVTDKSGKGIAGVTVTVKGGTAGTQTDNDGRFSISAPGNATLVFSSVGYSARRSRLVTGLQSR